MTRTCELPQCGFVFERFCTKQHADRSRSLTYRFPLPVSWKNIESLQHFGKLDEEGRKAVLLGQSKFSVVSFDIEATHLKANIGRIICCSFKPLGKKVYTLDGHQKGFFKQDVYDDSALAGAIRDELEKYDIIVGWNSKEFDVKFINARNLRAGQRTKKAQHHVDGMWSYRSKFAAWSGLNNVQLFIDAEGDRKTPIKWEQWMRALGWNKKLREAAMHEIVTHCEQDVKVLENIYRKLVEGNVVRSLRRDGGIL